MTEQFKEVKNKLDEKADKNDIVRMENELNPKVNALFDGYKQHTDILERIEKEVSRQDEIIMRRTK
jgi:predicted nuclease with TOPRIM domain